MAEVKFTRTQEKQYSGWVTCPSIGTKLPGTALVTTKEKPWVLSAPNGMQVLSATELAAGYLFKLDKGTEAITGTTATAKLVNGVIGWTPVVRNTAVVPAVMARHVAGKTYGGLGHFEMYPEQFGPQYTIKVPGNVFVRMYSLQGGLRNIATPEQAAAVTPKPTTELATAVKTSPVKPTAQTDIGKAAAHIASNTLDSVSTLFKAQLDAVGAQLKTVKGSVVTVTPVVTDADGAGNKFIRSDISFTFTVAVGKKGTLTIPVAVQEKDLANAVFNILPKGEAYGVASSGKVKKPVADLAQPLVKAIQDKALAMRDGVKVTPVTDITDALKGVADRACDVLKDKVAPMKALKKSGTVEITTADGSMGSVTCMIKSGSPYHCSFAADTNDMCAAAKCVKAGLVPENDKLADLKALASAIVTGFAKIKRQGITPVTAPVTSSKYEYRLIGKGKSETGEVLYILERISTGAKTTMNRPQLIKLLEEKRVENAFVRWYKNDRQIRLRTTGGLDDMDVKGLRRSALKRAEGAQNESTVLYSEIIKHLAKKGFTPEGELEVSADTPIFGTFAVKSASGIVITAMFSPTEWKYGATDGAKVNLKGVVPEDKRRRSMLASNLVSLILTAAKSAVTSAANPSAPIIPAQDDDFSDTEVTGVFEAADETALSAVEAFEGLGGQTAQAETAQADTVVAAADAFAGLEDASTPDATVLDAADAFAGLEDASTPDETVTPVTQVDPRIARLNGVLDSLVMRSAAINTRVTNTLAKTNLTAAECLKAGNDLMPIKRDFDLAVSELNALVDVSAGAYLPEFEEIIGRAAARNGLLNDALSKLGVKLQELQVKEAKQVSAARRKAELEAETKAEAQRQAEAQAQAQAAEVEAQRQAAEAESQRQEEEEKAAEEDPFAGLGDDIDSIFRNLPGEIVSEGK